MTFYMSRELKILQNPHTKDNDKARMLKMVILKIHKASEKKRGFMTKPLLLLVLLAIY